MESNNKERALSIVSLIISAALFVLFLCSCSAQIVPVESIRYDSVFFEKIQKDSIFIKDSVFIQEKGDTVFKNKYKTVYKYVLQRDTMFTVRVDSIPVPYPVEKKRTWWEQTKIDLATMAFVVVVIILLHFLIKWIIKRTRKI